MPDDEFDDLVMEARDLGIGDWTTAAKTDALASRIKRLVERKRKATASPSQSAGSLVLQKLSFDSNFGNFNI